MFILLLSTWVPRLRVCGCVSAFLHFEFTFYSPFNDEGKKNIYTIIVELKSQIMMRTHCLQML